MGRPKGSKNKTKQTKAAEATGPAEEPEPIVPVGSNTSSKKRKDKKSKANVAYKKNTGQKEFKRAKVYHTLKREVLAPYLAELYIRLHWKHLVSDLTAEVTVLSRLGEDDVSEADNSSYQEDWRSENETEGSNSGSSSS